MHELSIVKQLMTVAEAELDRLEEGATVTSLRVAVGRLSGASAESMKFAFEVLSPESRLNGCRLEIIEPKAVCACAECGYREEVDDYVSACPRCNSTSITVTGGNDLRLESMEVEDGS